MKQEKRQLGFRFENGSMGPIEMAKARKIVNKECGFCKKIFSGIKIKKYCSEKCINKIKVEKAKEKLLDNS